MPIFKGIFTLSYTLLFSIISYEHQGLKKPENVCTSKEIHFSLKPESKFQLPHYKAQADSAIKIAEAIFNSDAFQNKIANTSFKRSSYCKRRTSCKRNEKDNGVEINGKSVLEDLFKESNVSLALDVKSNGNALGSTCPNQYAITMYYNNIMKDMEDDPLPPSYKLAVNLCHEYMHQVGYCHIYGHLDEKNQQPDPRYMNADATYTIGWEAYYILMKWSADKQVIKGL